MSRKYGLWSNSIRIDDLLTSPTLQNMPKLHWASGSFIQAPRKWYRWLPWWIPSFQRWCGAVRVLFGLSMAVHFIEHENWRSTPKDIRSLPKPHYTAANEEEKS